MTKGNVKCDQPVDVEPDLMTILLSTDLFRSLDVDLLKEVAANLCRICLSPGDQLIKQGEPGDALYIVLRGQLRVVTEGENGQTLFRRIVGIHNTIGEIALLTGQTRTATVTADEQSMGAPVEVARLSRASFIQLTNQSPLVADALADAVTQLIRKRQLNTVLNTAQFFKTMDDGLRQAIEEELALVSLRSREMLFRQGDPSDSMYMVVSGRLQVVLENGLNDIAQDEQVLSELGQGDSLGEISLLTGKPRTATVYAVRDTEVAKLTRASYERLMVEFPLEATSAFVQPITDLVTSRDKQEQIAEAIPLTIALIPIQPDVTLTEFTQRLAKAFALFHPTIHLNSSHVDRALGKEAISQTIQAADHPEDKSSRNAVEVQLVNWLDELESNYRYLLYEADSGLTPWTLRSLRQADHILFVGHGDYQGKGDSSLDNLEKALLVTNQQRIGKKQSLVSIYHRTQKSDAEMADWIAEHQLQEQDWQEHYQIDWQAGEREFVNLVQRLSGESPEQTLDIDRVERLVGRADMDLVGKKIGKYKISAFIGRGGMASVYKAHQPGVERDVAIKVMHPHLATSLDFVDRFRREARSAGNLHHPNIISVIDFDMDAGLHYMVLNYVLGGTLEDLLRQQKMLSATEALQIAVRLGEALAYAHEQGIIHRDIKPANIMFFDETFQHVLLVDFGIAKLQDGDDDGLTVAGAIVGTPNYMSPEASQGQIVDERSDVYSLGVVLYEMVTGQTPYQATSLYTFLMKQANELPPPPRDINPEIPDWVNRLIMRLLENNPDDRFPSARAVVDLIRESFLVCDDTKTRAGSMRTMPSSISLKEKKPNQSKKLFRTRLRNYARFGFAPRKKIANAPKPLSQNARKTSAVTNSTKVRKWVLLAVFGTVVLFIALLTVSLLLWVDLAT